ncbi:MAG: hypothetical protein PHG24_02045 [Candidatus Pacebacteria bacterium]|nr:hypothetical protein [Candidatus Paceibacterota bacterium]
MNFENPNKKETEPVRDSVSEALKLVRDMSRAEKTAFFEAMGGELKHVSPREEKEVGEGISYGVEPASAYKEAQERMKNGY